MKFIMNFLRSPFQFRSTDQPSRKTESDSSVENMFIDPSTGLTTDSKWRAASPGIGSSSSISGSPRLQHRVPGFENNGNSPGEVINEPSAQQSASTDDGEKSQRVHVVPIKVESVDDAGTPKKRSNVFHSSSGNIPRSNHFGPLYPNFEEFHNRKRHSSGPTLHKKPDTTESKAKVCNIPIFIEGRDTLVVPKTTTSPQSSQNVPGHNIPSQNTQSETLKQNGGSLTKCSAKSKNKDDAKQCACDVSLKQISSILSELQSLKTSVNEFSGVPQDKQYRYLDEMLTRCMLKLDDVETHGDDEVRASRKAAIKAVQESINDLESRSQANTKVTEAAGGSGDNTSDFTDTKMEGICDVPKEETVGENMQGSSKTTDKTEDPSVVSEQSAVKETEVMQQESSCLQKMSPVSSKCKESAEATTGFVEPADTVVAKDQNENCKQSEDSVSEPVDMEDVSVATNEPVNVLEELKTSEESAKTMDEPMDSVEVTGISSQSTMPGGLFQQNEPMDSEVPEPIVKSDSEMAAIKDGSVECEIELTKENTSLEENKNSSIPN